MMIRDMCKCTGIEIPIRGWSYIAGGFKRLSQVCSRNNIMGIEKLGTLFRVVLPTAYLTPRNVRTTTRMTTKIRIATGVSIVKIRTGIPTTPSMKMTATATRMLTTRMTTTRAGILIATSVLPTA